MNAEAWIGLVGAVIGAGASYLVSKQAIEAERKKAEIENAKYEKYVEKIIDLFLIRELERNFNFIKDAKFLDTPILELKHEKLNRSYGQLHHDYGFKEFEEVKHKLLEMASERSLDIISFYEMFILIKEKEFGKFTKPELLFVQNTFTKLSEEINKRNENLNNEYQIT